MKMHSPISAYMKDSRYFKLSNIIAITDIIAMLISYVIANKIKFDWWRTGIMNNDTSYMTLYVYILVAYLVVEFFMPRRHRLISRGLVGEFIDVAYTHLYVVAVVTVYLYVTKTSENYSREQMILFFIISIFVMFIERKMIKQVALKWVHRSGNEEKIVLVTTSDKAEEIVCRIKKTQNWDFRITAIAVIDKDLREEYIDDIEIVASADTLIKTVEEAEVDALFLCLDEDDDKFLPTNSRKELVDKFCDMGKKVHINTEIFETSKEMTEQQMLGEYAVITYRLPEYKKGVGPIRRILDIVVGLALFLPYIAVYLLVCVGHFLEGDNGVTVISIPKVTRNGRRFYQHRFRTVKRKSSKRKKQSCGVTGKIIRGLGIGWLPQCINLIWGDESLAGPKPPLVSEYLDYTPEQKKSLCVKAGVFAKGLSYSVFEKEELFVLDMMEEEERPLDLGEGGFLKENPVYNFLKRAADIVISACALAVLSPFFLILAIMIKWSDGGNVFYRQVRLGKYGRKIRIYKFRTMHMKFRRLEKSLSPEQYEKYLKEYKIDDDPRITKMGETMRRTSVDELPQLWNVLKGEMSLIGPRPIVEKELSHYKGNEKKLLSVKPGITGYWGANGRNNITYDSGQRQNMELYYVENAGIMLDIKIFLGSIPAVLKRRGAK